MPERCGKLISEVVISESIIYKHLKINDITVQPIEALMSTAKSLKVPRSGTFKDLADLFQLDMRLDN